MPPIDATALAESHSTEWLRQCRLITSNRFQVQYIVSPAGVFPRDATLSWSATVLSNGTDFPTGKSVTVRIGHTLAAPERDDLFIQTFEAMMQDAFITLRRFQLFGGGLGLGVGRRTAAGFPQAP